MAETAKAVTAGDRSASAGAVAETRRTSLSLPVFLASGIGSLVLVAVLAVRAVGMWSSIANTLDLLRDKAEIGISSIVAQVSQHLDPAEHQLRYVADLLARREVLLEDEARFTDILIGALAAAPQISAIVFIDTEHQLIGVDRVDGKPVVYRRDYSRDGAVLDAVRAGWEAEAAAWGPPLWREKLGTTVINLRQPMRREGRYLGILIGIVTIGDLSAYLGALETIAGTNGFILYDRNAVLAHPNLIGRQPQLSEAMPLPMVSRFGDPVLQAIWQQEDRYPLRIVEGTDLEGHALDVLGERYTFIYREVAGFGPLPWQIGAYFGDEAIGAERDRLIEAGVVGLCALVVACLAAVLFARFLSRPVVQLSEAARHISRLDIAGVGELPRGLFRELNHQIDSFNSMLRGLRWFEVYVPRTLVHRLVKEGDPGVLVSVRRAVSVMFTDIAGFTRLAEGMDAPDVAGFLNEHFALVAGAVEREGGTVDKFIGDSVMAFWGAPEKQKNRAERAGRAALAIGDAIRADNERRRAAGLAPVGIRIGLYSGTVTVGNIGAPGRMNYTIVGDAVNVAQRLEQLCKEVYPAGTEVAILAGDATVADLGPGFGPVSIGARRLRGRAEEIEVFRLI